MTPNRSLAATEMSPAQSLTSEVGENQPIQQNQSDIGHTLANDTALDSSMAFGHAEPLGGEAQSANAWQEPSLQSIQAESPQMQANSQWVDPTVVPINKKTAAPPQQGELSISLGNPQRADGNQIQIPFIVRQNESDPGIKFRVVVRIDHE